MSKRGQEIFDRLQQIADIIPRRACVDMVDSFLARVKVANDTEERSRAIDTLKLACTIMSIKDFEKDDADVTEREWKARLKATFEDLIGERTKRGEWTQDGKWMERKTVVVDRKDGISIDTMCPYCYSKFIVPAGMPKDSMPCEDDGSLCSTCYEPSLFSRNDAGEYFLRKPTAEELPGLQEMDHEFQDARGKLRAIAKRETIEEGHEPEQMHIIFRHKKNV